MITNSTWAARQNSAVRQPGSGCRDLGNPCARRRKRSNLDGEYLSGLSLFLFRSSQRRRPHRPSVTNQRPRRFSQSARLLTNKQGRPEAGVCRLHPSHFHCGTRPRTVDVSIIAYRVRSGGTHKRKKNEKKNIIERDWPGCHEPIRVVD
jgi:hypothetical protein